MPSLLSKIAQRIQRIYQKAGDFIEEEREFPISQVFLNATFQRFVTDNVEILEDLHADLHNDWLRLYATLNVKGMHLVLGVILNSFKWNLTKTCNSSSLNKLAIPKSLKQLIPIFSISLGLMLHYFSIKKF